MMTAGEALKKYFGYDAFKPGQEEVIETILAGRDVLAVMPTGAGKSVCYQVPALLLPGITMVISPLISLMQDQVKALNEAGIHAGYINSSLTNTQISKVYENAAKGAYRILYVAPERLETADFMDFTDRVRISMVTVDEAHCISQWGQDFRPSYLKIVDFIGRLRERPVVSAFTATATEEVKTDIAFVLRLRVPKIVVTGFDRENLYFDVETTKAKDDYVLDYIRRHPDDSGIIYCATRKNVDALYALLAGAGVPVTRYHAGMANADRKKSQEDFIYDRTPVIVATNAFGMGIDKSNVRFVIHYNMPQSMENYYQEAGRAGRDGEPARCVLLFSLQDIMINKFLLDHKDFTDIPYEDVELIRQRDAKRLQIMEGYVRTTGCLRNYILSYFGERRKEACGSCGNCQREFTQIDMTAEARQVVNCVWETKGRYGLNVVLGTLLGARRARLKELGTTAYKTYGALKNHTEAELRLLVSRMIEDGYLCQTTEKYSVIRLGNIAPLRDPDTRVLVRSSGDWVPESPEPPALSELPALSGLSDPQTAGQGSAGQKMTGQGAAGQGSAGQGAAGQRTTGQKKSGAGRSVKITDALTKAGFELFGTLRKLRYTIAAEEGLPPYIVFSDRTLADMSVKLPHDKETMLGVAGVGEAKYDKYGARFIDAVREFLDTHPDAVTAIEEPGEDPGDRSAEKEKEKKTKEKKEKKQKKQKSPFYLNPADGDLFEYSDPCLISEIRDRLNEITSADNVRRLFGTDIFRLLTQMGYVEEKEIDGRQVQTQTEAGISRGITTTEKISKAGNPYTVLLYPPAVQKEIVKHYIEIGKQMEKWEMQ